MHILCMYCGGTMQVLCWYCAGTVIVLCWYCAVTNTAVLPTVADLLCPPPAPPACVQPILVGHTLAPLIGAGSSSSPGAGYAGCGAGRRLQGAGCGVCRVRGRVVVRGAGCRVWGAQGQKQGCCAGCGVRGAGRAVQQGYSCIGWRSWGQENTSVTTSTSTLPHTPPPS